jgi:hypothetical protein
MPVHLDIAPFPAKHARAVDKKGAALNPQDLLAIEGFFFEHAILTAERLVLIGEELEGKALGGLEPLMGSEAVP